MEQILAPPQRAAAIMAAVTFWCGLRGWSSLAEVTLPNGRRADLLTLAPDGAIAAIEVKSCQRDFDTDLKWPEYLDYCDRLYFAVDLDFPLARLPAAAGILVAAAGETALLREAPAVPLAPGRRKVLTLRFARLAALRLLATTAPRAAAGLRAAGACE